MIVVSFIPFFYTCLKGSDMYLYDNQINKSLPFAGTSKPHNIVISADFS